MNKAHLYARGIVRWVLKLRCEVCGQRDRRCWKWHVEVGNFPTCGSEINEFHPSFWRVFDTLPGAPWLTINGHPVVFDPRVGAWVQS